MSYYYKLFSLFLIGQGGFGVYLASAGELDLPGTSIYQQNPQQPNTAQKPPKESQESSNPSEPSFAPRTEPKPIEKRKNTNLLPTKPREIGASNLPNIYQRSNPSSSEGQKKSQVILPQVQDERLYSLRAGDEFDVEILHSVIAFSDERAPVVGRIISGAFRGAKILGSSRLEKNSKRVFIEFQRLSLRDSEYEIQGVALTLSGQSGFIGEYHSREAEYFGGEFLSAMTAAFFEGQVPRYTNFLGQTQEDHSMDSAVKKGLAAGAMSTAELFKEKLKKVPEFSEIRGPFRTKILIQNGNKRVH